MKKLHTNNHTCFNISTETFNGKEQSPKGLGYSAVVYDIGFEKQGKDGQIWSVQLKNNKKVWFRKSGMPLITHEEPIITANGIREIPIEPLIEPPISIEIPQEPQTEIPKKTNKTDYNIFYSYYTNKLKTENSSNGIKKDNKTIKDETIAEWNRIKKNKKELETLMISIKNKT